MKMSKKWDDPDTPELVKIFAVVMCGAEGLHWFYIGEALQDRYFKMAEAVYAQIERLTNDMEEHDKLN